jgi:phosphoglucomutase
MDAGLCTICGEESFGTSSNHVREKDGLWAVLCWLSLLAKTRKSVAQTVRDHWERFGRSFFQRHDYEALDAGAAADMIAVFRKKLDGLAGLSLAGSRVILTDDFSYRDPVDGRVSEHQGLRILLTDNSRIVCRLSGTGTEGATLRLYVERYRSGGVNSSIESILGPLLEAALQLLELRERCGRNRATVIT